MFGVLFATVCVARRAWMPRAVAIRNSREPGTRETVSVPHGHDCGRILRSLCRPEVQLPGGGPLDSAPVRTSPAPRSALPHAPEPPRPQGHRHQRRTIVILPGCTRRTDRRAGPSESVVPPSGVFTTTTTGNRPSSWPGRGTRAWTPSVGIANQSALSWTVTARRRRARRAPSPHDRLVGMGRGSFRSRRREVRSRPSSCRAPRAEPLCSVSMTALRKASPHVSCRGELPRFRDEPNRYQVRGSFASPARSWWPGAAPTFSPDLT